MKHPILWGQPTEDPACYTPGLPGSKIGLSFSIEPLISTQGCIGVMFGLLGLCWGCIGVILGRLKIGIRSSSIEPLIGLGVQGLGIQGLGYNPIPLVKSHSPQPPKRAYNGATSGRVVIGVGCAFLGAPILTMQLFWLHGLFMRKHHPAVIPLPNDEV